MDNLICRKCGARFKSPILCRYHEEHQCTASTSVKDQAPVPVESQTLATLSPKNERCLFTPKPDPHFVIPDSLRQRMKRLAVQATKGPVNVLVLGPQGSGKTSIALQYAAMYQRPCCIVPCVTMQEPQEWWGARHFDPSKGDYYTSSLFVEAVETPNAVVILDDMNRVENPKVLNPLFPLLDDRRQSWVEDMGRFLTVAKGVIFFATVNEGWEFQGVDPICRALKDRFYQISMGHPPPDVMVEILKEKAGLDKRVAAKLVSLVQQLRTNPKEAVDISMRQVILAAKDIMCGASVRDAVVYTFLVGLPEESREAVLISLQQVVDATEMKVEDETWNVWA